jgi:hypothetical protein
MNSSMNFIKYNREGRHKPKKQEAHQIIDITLWPGGEEIKPYEEGAREKNKITCPSEAPFPFLIPGHHYMFKQSNHRYPTQFWVEIIAYRLGCLMGVRVPPAFVGIDTTRKIGGAVIEWFYNYPGEVVEEYVPGGDLFQKLNPQYERKKGKQHNLMDFTKVVAERDLVQNWQEEWAKIFCFDALIGNTDRHQDNWGILHYQAGDCFSPAFDNGTAMGHEIIDRKIPNKVNDLEKYVSASKATHHMKWDRHDEKKIKHVDFLKKLIEQFPKTKEHIYHCLNFSTKSFEQEVCELLDLSNALSEDYVKLNPERGNFIIKLIEYRFQKVLEILT